MRALTSILAAAAASLALPARANAPAPEYYGFDLTTEGNVVITVNDYAERACPDQGLLRRDVDTGEIVLITACQGDAFLDECPPAGRYQYGLAEPLVCHETAGTLYYGELTVPAPETRCERCCMPTGPAPVAAEGVPWSADPYVCESSYVGQGGRDGQGCHTGGAVLGTNLLALAIGLALWRRRADRRGA